MADADPDEHVAKPPLGAWETVAAMDYMAIELQMIVSAILIIWVGAHASLRRPPSAAPPAKKKRRKGCKGRKEDDDDQENFVGGFEAMDAIKFPVIAAAMLIGLYYLIKWLQDPAILNKFLRLYMAVTGFASTGVFFGDLLQLALHFVFPGHWRDGRGRLYKIDPRSRSQKLLAAGGTDGEDDAAFKEAPVDTQRRTPFPGLLSKLSVPRRVTGLLYSIRHLAMEEWTLELSLFHLGKETVPFKATGLSGVLLGIVVQCLYLYTSTNMLANVIGLAVCYMAFQYVSVTSFAIGSSVLAGLFIYDIVMVFYTPFMVAVATQLDAPIKLTYESANRSSILGLGDIVVPGIFICLALRFDLWKHYQRKITREKTELETVAKEGGGRDAAAALSDGGATTTTGGGEVITTVETAYREVKAPFLDPRGQWGDRFWTSTWAGMLLGRSSLASLNARVFTKTYFRATIFGYLLGMLATLVVLITTKHGQPALLYLVPGVVGAAYLTGWWRGELGDMWTYTEDGSLDVADVVVDVDGNGNVLKPPPPNKEGSTDKKGAAAAAASGKKKKGKGGKGRGDDKKKKKKNGEGEEEEDDSYELFSLSVKLPREEEEHSVKED